MDPREGLPTCSCCGDPLLFSARQRGDGLCGPCSRAKQACNPLDLGPATRADLAELDAVPEPVDSDAPAATQPPGRRDGSEEDHLMHARTLARARP